MRKQYFDASAFLPPKGRHADKHTKIRSDIPEIAIAKVEKAVAKRLKRWARDIENDAKSNRR